MPTRYSRRSLTLSRAPLPLIAGSVTFCPQDRVHAAAPVASRPPALCRSQQRGVYRKRDRGERMAVTETMVAPAKESFAALLDGTPGVASGLEGTVIKGRGIA